MKLTFKAAKQQVNDLGLVLGKNVCGEFLVKRRSSSDAYFTNDLQDAVDTAQRIADQPFNSVAKVAITRAGNNDVTVTLKNWEYDLLGNLLRGVLNGTITRENHGAIEHVLIRLTQTARTA